MKKKLVTVIGARPQIIKAAAISRAVNGRFRDQLEEIIVHTGQHYDANMSQVFFDEMAIPEPSYQLNAGSGFHGAQTAKMIDGLEPLLLKEKPDAVLVYGDTNSTLAAALTASKLKIPVVHVEAGLRSFDKTMPEEINRVLCDHVSTILFAPTQTAVNNLSREGFELTNSAPYSFDHPLVCKSGDVMYDNAIYYADRITAKNKIDGPFILATIHRDHNTDDTEKLRRLLDALGKIHRDFGMKILMPLHPRTKEKISDEIKKGLSISSGIEMIPPVSYLEMLALENQCTLIITDSGGVQKEAYFFKKPCVIMRPHTEWVEIVSNGNARLAGDSEEKMLDGVKYFLNQPTLTWPSLFGKGNAAEEMCELILKHI